MKKKWLEEYFTFSKKERNGVLVLVLLIGAVLLFPYYFPSSGEIDSAILASLDSTSFSAIREEKAQGYRLREESNAYQRYPPSRNERKGSLFMFDPNTLSEEGWIKLGVKERTAKTIAKFISKGGHFKKPEDLQKIFGLSPKLVEQLIPFVKIAATEKNDYPTNFARHNTAPDKKAERQPIDINLADSIGLVKLKGIGPKLAGRILRFRDRLGGFHSASQLKEVYGLPDSTLQLILPELRIDGTGINKIKINQADVNSLRQHPYIGWNLAKLIIRYREEHGAFKSIEDLMKIDVMTGEIVAKLTPYIDFSE